MHVDYSLAVKGYAEVLATKINLDCVVSNDPNQLKGNHEHLAIVKNWFSSMKPVKYNVDIKGFIYVAGIKLDVNEHFSNEDKQSSGDKKSSAGRPKKS